jgi:hypothetical protein
MIRMSTILWALLVTVSGYAMFQVKYEVMQLEDKIVRINRSIAASQESVRVLNAEWSFLNQPNRLDQLAKRYLSLGPINTAQIGRVDALPRRPGTADETAVTTAAAPSLAPAGTRFANVELAPQ